MGNFKAVHKLGIFLSVLLLVTLNSCAQSNNENEMKKTVARLMQALQSCDSTAIIEMYAGNKEKEEGKKLIWQNCRLFKKISEKYGFPERKDMILTKMDSMNNVITVTLINQEDVQFGMEKCDLVVWFYNDRFLRDPKRFINFTLNPKQLYQKKAIRATLPPLNK